MLLTNSYGLFSDEFAVIRDAANEAVGRIYCIDDDLGRNTNLTVDFSMGYIDGSMVRDTLIFNNVLIPGLMFGVDLIIVPAFIEFNDVGISNSIVPLAFGFRTGYNIINTSVAKLNIGAMIGIESVSTYQGIILANLKSDFTWQITAGLYWGINIGYNIYSIKGNVQGIFSSATGLKYQPDKFGVIVGFDILSVYKTLRLGTIYAISPRFSAMLGGGLTLEYYGYDLNIGVEASKIKMGRSFARFATSFSYTGGGTFSVYASMGFEIRKKRRLK